MITLNDLFNQYHLLKLFFFLQPFLVFIQFELSVDLSDKSFVTMDSWVEIAHVELHDHLGDLIGVGNVQFFFGTL